MLCKKCNKPLPDDATFCCWCGKKQTAEKRKTRKRANAQGSVVKLSGTRTRPYMALMPCKPNKNGKSKRPILGYYETKTQALDELNKALSMNVSDRVDMTLETAYNEWSTQHFKQVSDHRADMIKVTWKKLQPLYKRRIKDLRANDVQKIVNEIESSGKSLSMCNEIKILYGELCRYAMSLDIIYQDYSKFLKLPKREKKEKKVFTAEQIERIHEFAKSGNETAMIIYILIYSGFRIGELLDIKRDQINVEEGYMIGGEKTEAGKNRLIPFHDNIIPFIQYFYNKETQYLIATKTGKKYIYSNFRQDIFIPFLESLDIHDMTLHCTRHTFATLGQAAGVSQEDMIKLIGHTDYKTTTENYVHQNLETLKKAINKL